MKIARRILPLLLVIFAVICAGCMGGEKKKVAGVIKSELDLLKNLDAETTQKYISYEELFPDTEEGLEQSDEIEEVFSLFFRDFDYKILDIDVDKEKGTAQASLRLVTLDAQALAADFASARLKNEIVLAADAGSQSTEESTVSLRKRYLILNGLLKNNTYQTVERNCTMTLTVSGSGDEEVWEIKRTYTLENDLVGGLMTYISDPDILSPEDTLAVYLKTLKKMDLDDMSNFLGAESILNTEDAPKNDIAQALVEQVHSSFDYEVKESTVTGYSAVVTAEITTFDSDAILDAYQQELDAYLASPDAVIDGASRRYQKSYEMLLDSIESNKSSRSVQAEFHLINDGASWKLEDAGTELGAAIFGNLATSPVTDSEE